MTLIRISALSRWYWSIDISKCVFLGDISINVKYWFEHNLHTDL